MKGIILGFGRVIIDILVIVCFVAAFIAFIVSWVYGSFLSALFVFVCSLVGIFLGFFTLYLLIDIRDALVKK